MLPLKKLKIRGDDDFATPRRKRDGCPQKVYILCLTSFCQLATFPATTQSSLSKKYPVQPDDHHRYSSVTCFATIVLPAPPLLARGL